MSLDRRLRAALASGGILGLIGLVAGCAAAVTFGPASLDDFRGADHLLHDRDVVGITGAPLPQGSRAEGMVTTASALRLMQTSGFEPRLSEAASATLDEVATAASTDAADVDLVVGAARACALAASTSVSCDRVRELAVNVLDDPRAAPETMVAVEVIDAAADLGLSAPTAGGALAKALANQSDPCIAGATFRYRARLYPATEPTPAPAPRKSTDAVLAALRAGDLDRALCLSGFVAATAGATPVGDEDWLQEPFDDAVAVGFTRSSVGMYAALDRRRGQIETTRMLSQVSFDLSVNLR